MAKDRKNVWQETPKQIRQKVKIGEIKEISSSFADRIEEENTGIEKSDSIQCIDSSEESVKNRMSIQVIEFKNNDNSGKNTTIIL